MNTDGMSNADAISTPATARGKGRRRERLSRAEAKEETRRLLLDAAEAVFGGAGYHAASIDQVAAEAGFTKGAVYSAFDSKADLFLAVLSRRAAGRRAEIESVLAQSDSLDDFVAGVSRRFALTVGRDRDLWAAVIEFMTVVGRDRSLQQRFALHHDATREALADSVRNWKAEALSIDPRRLATAVLALNNGLTLEALLSPEEVDVELYVEAQVALMNGARPGHGKGNR